jgi:DNA-directed RNA polymerase specialized sigma24 family protein
MYSNELVISNLRKRLAIDKYGNYPGCTIENAEHAFKQATLRAKLKFPGGISLEDLEEYLSREVKSYFINVSINHMESLKKDLVERLSEKFRQCSEKEVEDVFFAAKEKALTQLQKEESINKLKHYLYKIMFYQLIKLADKKKKIENAESDFSLIHIEPDEHNKIYSQIDRELPVREMKIIIMEKLIENLVPDSDEYKIMTYSREGKKPKEIAELMEYDPRKISKIKFLVIKKFKKLISGKKQSDILNSLK